MLLQIEEQGGDCTSLSVPIALRLARAARDTLISEERLALLRVKEYEIHLGNLQDNAEEAHARVQEADHQVGSLLSCLDSCGISANEGFSTFTPLQLITSDPQSLLFSDLHPPPSLGAEFESSTDSGSEHIWDAGCRSNESQDD